MVETYMRLSNNFIFDSTVVHPPPPALDSRSYLNRCYARYTFSKFDIIIKRLKSFLKKKKIYIHIYILYKHEALLQEQYNDAFQN